MTDKIFVEDARGQLVRVYTTAEAAEKTGYSPQHIRLMADLGKWRGWKVGRDWVVALPD